MRFLLVALLCALSYAQTECPEGTELRFRDSGEECTWTDTVTNFELSEDEHLPVLAAPVNAGTINGELTVSSGVSYVEIYDANDQQCVFGQHDDCLHSSSATYEGNFVVYEPSDSMTRFSMEFAATSIFGIQVYAASGVSTGVLTISWTQQSGCGREAYCETVADANESAAMWTFTVSMVMTDNCVDMAYTPSTGVIDLGDGATTNFYNVGVVLERPIGMCTTNIIGSSVMFTCEGDYINEHVYRDASQGPVPDEPDCSGDVMYVMPIYNGCTKYSWGSMSAVWSDYCVPDAHTPDDNVVSRDDMKWIPSSLVTNNVVAEPFEVEVLSSGHVWTEGPLIVDGMLYFSDVMETAFNSDGYPYGAIWKVDPELKTTELFIRNSGIIGTDNGVVTTINGDLDYSNGWIELGSNGLEYQDGMMIVCQHGAQRIIMFPMDRVVNGMINEADVTVLVDSYNGLSLNTPNDMSILGNILYFTDPPYGLQYIDAEGIAGDYKSIAPQGTFRVFAYDMTTGDLTVAVDLGPDVTPNGIIATELNGGTRLVVARTEPSAALFVYDNDGSGFTQNAFLLTDGSSDSDFGVPPADSSLFVFCDGLSLYNGYIFASCSGGVRILTIDTLEYVGQVYTNNLNSNNYISDGWLYMTMNDDIVRVKLQVGFSVNENDMLMYGSGYVCGQNFGLDEASAVCSMLGYSGVTSWQSGQSIPPGSSFSVESLDCPLGANQISDCTFLSSSCNPTQDGVQILCNSNACSAGNYYIPPTADQCSSTNGQSGISLIANQQVHVISIPSDVYTAEIRMTTTSGTAYLLITEFSSGIEVGNCIFGLLNTCQFQSSNIYEGCTYTFTTEGDTQIFSFQSSVQVFSLAVATGDVPGSVQLSYSWSQTPCPGQCVVCSQYTGCSVDEIAVCDGTEMVVCMSTETPAPTSLPTSSPSNAPTSFPTPRPTSSPSNSPSPQPTPMPTEGPTPQPTPRPTSSPSNSPTPQPTPRPTSSPSDRPTPDPSSRPTMSPTTGPTNPPTSLPTSSPTNQPTPQPTDYQQLAEFCGTTGSTFYGICVPGLDCRCVDDCTASNSVPSRCVQSRFEFETCGTFDNTYIGHCVADFSCHCVEPCLGDIPNVCVTIRSEAEICGEYAGTNFGYCEVSLDCVCVEPSCSSSSPGVNTCVAYRALGQSCGDNAVAELGYEGVCQSGLSCTDGTCVQLESLGPGSCGSDFHVCAGDLTCVGNNCVDIKTIGESCTVDGEFEYEYCAEGLICDCVGACNQGSARVCSIPNWWKNCLAHSGATWWCPVGFSGVPSLSSSCFLTTTYDGLRTDLYAMKMLRNDATYGAMECFLGWSLDVDNYAVASGQTIVQWSRDLASADVCFDVATGATRREMTAAFGDVYRTYGTITTNQEECATQQQCWDTTQIFVDPAVSQRESFYFRTCYIPTHVSESTYGHVKQNIIDAGDYTFLATYNGYCSVDGINPASDLITLFDIREFDSCIQECMGQSTCGAISYIAEIDACTLFSLAEYIGGAPVADQTITCYILSMPQPTFNPSPAPTPFPSSRPTESPTESPTPSPTAFWIATEFGDCSVTCGGGVRSRTVVCSSFREEDCEAGARPVEYNLCNTETCAPTGQPTTSPTTSPTASPSPRPSPSPSSCPTTSPSTRPTDIPSPCPSTRPTGSPTTVPSDAPSPSPSSHPSTNPTPRPTDRPTSTPTESPSVEPTTKSPSFNPTTESPSEIPTTSCASLGGLYDDFCRTTCDVASSNYDCHLCYDYCTRDCEFWSQCNRDRNTEPVQTTAVPNCADIAYWNDIAGVLHTCAWYASDDSRCETYGSRYQNYGFTANTACCACGGGVTLQTEEPEIELPYFWGCQSPGCAATTELCLDPNQQYSIQCLDIDLDWSGNEFLDITVNGEDGGRCAPGSDTQTIFYTCGTYTAPDSGCITATVQASQFVDFFPYDGYFVYCRMVDPVTTAAPITEDPTLQPTETAEPTFPPAKSPTPLCQDYTLADGNPWHDNLNDGFTCEWYERDYHFCVRDGDRYGNEETGMTANEACCFCGGGQRVFTETSQSPTMLPTKSPIINFVQPSQSPTPPSMKPTGSPVCADSEFVQAMYGIRFPGLGISCRDAVIIALFNDDACDGDLSALCPLSCGVCTDAPTESPTRGATTAAPTASCGDGVCLVSEMTVCPQDCAAEILRDVCRCATTYNACEETCRSSTDLFAGDETCSGYLADNVCGPVIVSFQEFWSMCGLECTTTAPETSQLPSQTPTKTPITSEPTSEPTLSPTETIECGDGICNLGESRLCPYDCPQEFFIDLCTCAARNNMCGRTCLDFEGLDTSCEFFARQPICGSFMSHVQTLDTICGEVIGCSTTMGPYQYKFHEDLETISCSLPWEKIIDEAQCRDAATVLNAIYVATGSYPVPFGCIADVDKERVWFNTNVDGTAAGHRRPVCVRSQSLPPTVARINPSASPSPQPTACTLPDLDLFQNCVDTCAQCGSPYECNSQGFCDCPASTVAAQLGEECSARCSTCADGLTCNSGVCEIPTGDDSYTCGTTMEECEAAYMAAMTPAVTAMMATETMDSCDAADGWWVVNTLNGLAGYDADTMSVCQSGGEYMIQYNGMVYPTCVAYGDPDNACGDSDLICPENPNNVGVFGYAGNQRAALASALTRNDFMHPMCPTSTCKSMDELADSGSYWKTQLMNNQYTNVDESTADNVCVTEDNEVMFITTEGKYNTCLGWSSNAAELCDSQKFLCAGHNGQGLYTYGWPGQLARTLAKAVTNTDGNYMHPQCPLMICSA